MAVVLSRRSVLALGVLAVLALTLGVGTVGVRALPVALRVTCTAGQKAARQKALAAYRTRIVRDRKAYFKTHTSKKQRATFVKRQQARLKALQLEARCATARPDTRPPALSAAALSGSTLTLTFDERLAGQASPSAFSVRVGNLSWPVTAVAVAGDGVTLTLALAVDGGQAVTVSYGPSGALTDVAGNAVAAIADRPVTNSSPPPPTPSPEPGFSPAIPKPGFADNHAADQPWVGEWGPKTDPYWLPSTGTLHGLIIPVDFSDAHAIETVDFYKNYLVPTAESYYRENSYGKLTLDLQMFPRWVRMSRPAADYGLSAQSYPQAKVREFVQEVTGSVDSEVDFSTVDAIYMVAPETTRAISILLFRAWPGEGIVRDGKELRWGAVGGGSLDTRGPSANLFAHHLITHETGHLMGGLADLYDHSQLDGGALQFAWAGRWDIMSDNRASSHMFAWNKWLLGWLDPKQLRGLTAPGTTEATLTPLELPGGLKAVVVPISSTVVYVIEDRQRIGEDRELCGNGVLVWIVDGSRFNTDHNAVVQAAGHSYNDACGAIYDAGYDAGAGKVSSFEDSNVRMEVLEALSNGNYKIRVTRK